MNWDDLKDPVCYPCLGDSVIIFWSVTQEVASLNNHLVATYFFVTEIIETIKGKLK